MEHLYLKYVSCNCTPRCAKWPVTEQEASRLLTWLWLDSEFLSPSATCFLSLLGDFGDWIRIYIFSQNFWEMILIKSIRVISHNHNKRNVIWWDTLINQLDLNSKWARYVDTPPLVSVSLLNLKSPQSHRLPGLLWELRGKQRTSK